MAQYATVGEADAYFGTRLHSGLWDETSIPDRNAALAQASRMIDQLSYAGEKSAAYTERTALGGNRTDHVAVCVNETLVNQAGLTQELQFPRGTDIAVPVDIKIACYEIAYALLDGRDADADLEDVANVSRGFGTARRDRKSVV